MHQLQIVSATVFNFYHLPTISTIHVVHMHLYNTACHTDHPFIVLHTLQPSFYEYTIAVVSPRALHSFSFLCLAYNIYVYTLEKIQIFWYSFSEGLEMYRTFQIVDTLPKPGNSQMDFLYIPDAVQGTISCVLDRWWVLDISYSAVHMQFPAHLLHMYCK